jgi:hypothetical protein
MPQIRPQPLNTISNYNRFFRSMIKNQLQKKSMSRTRELTRSRTPNRSGTHSRFRAHRSRTHSRSRAMSRPRENNTTNHTKKVYKQLIQLQIQKKAKNQTNRMAAKKHPKEPTLRQD